MSSSGVTSAIRSSRQRGAKTLALFLTAGFPKKDSTRFLVPVLATAGADIIELGMPFSDPLADGPVIQRSSDIALKNGMTLAGVLDDVRTIRAETSVPIVLMGYLNPIVSYGAERFFDEAAAAGVDGLILPELPLEETGRFRSDFMRNDLAQILLVAPTTSAERIAAIDEASSGFLYCVSMTGVTGATGRVATEDYLARVKSIARKNPVLVGFGITSPEEARRASTVADGVIIGSALIARLWDGQDIGSVTAWVASIKRALR